MRISLSSKACSALEFDRLGGLRSQRQIARRIHQHHAIRRQPVYRRSHQIANCLRLAIGQRAMAQLQHHRGLGRPLFFAKQRIVRQHQMHAGRFDIGERTHRVFELAFESALVVHLFVELRPHPVRLVEKLKAQPPALHAAFGRRREARFVQLRGWNPDARAIGGRLKRNLRLGQDLVHLARIVRFEIDVQCAPVRAHRVPREPTHQCSQQQCRRHRPSTFGRGHLRPAQPGQPP